MERRILVQRNTYGRIKYLDLILEDDIICREWGLIDGKAQKTSNTYDYINKGKANELSPSEAAFADFNRLVEKREKEGYLSVESLDSIPDLEQTEQMDFDNLPVQFCCSKPHKTILPKRLNKLIKQDAVSIFQKENGLCHFVLKTSTGEIKIYTRRIDDHTRKYPKIVKAVEDLGIPDNTLFVMEFTVGISEEFPTHMKRYKRIQSISRTDTLKGKVKDSVKRTLELQEETPVIAVLFNVLFLDGEDKTKSDYDSVMKLMQDMESYDTSGFITTPREFTFTSYEEAYAYAEENIDLIEGFVVWIKAENSEITYNGKPNRRACYKLKALREDDVVAYAWAEGSGDRQGLIGSFLIGKYDLNGNMIPFGNVGSGIKDEDANPEDWVLPCVIEINYEQRFETGKYQFPRFSKRHEDKIPSDVVIDEDGM